RIPWSEYLRGEWPIAGRQLLAQPFDLRPWQVGGNDGGEEPRAADHSLLEEVAEESARDVLDSTSRREFELGRILESRKFDQVKALVQRCQHRATRDATHDFHRRVDAARDGVEFGMGVELGGPDRDN